MATQKQNAGPNQDAINVDKVTPVIAVILRKIRALAAYVLGYILRQAKDAQNIPGKKKTVAEKSISYIEAAKLHPLITKSYADICLNIHTK